MGKGRPRQRDIPPLTPRPRGEQDLVPWLRAAADRLVGVDLDAAQRALDDVGVRLFTRTVRDPWPPGTVGELIAYENTIHAQVDGGTITAVHVDDW